MTTPLDLSQNSSRNKLNEQKETKKRKYDSIDDLTQLNSKKLQTQISSNLATSTPDLLKLPYLYYYYLNELTNQNNKQLPTIPPLINNQLLTNNSLPASQQQQQALLYYRNLLNSYQNMIPTATIPKIEPFDNNNTLNNQLNDNSTLLTPTYTPPLEQSIEEQKPSVNSTKTRKRRRQNSSNENSNSVPDINANPNVICL